MNRKRIDLYIVVVTALVELVVVGLVVVYLLGRDARLWLVALGIQIPIGVVTVLLLVLWPFVVWSARERRAALRRWYWRWQRIKQLPLGVLGVLIGMAVLSSVAGLMRSERGVEDLWLNLGTELAGAVVTYILIDLVTGTRQRRETLIREMGSDVRSVALSAVERLRDGGWLFDGSLKLAYLGGANLEGADLRGAFLEATFLATANLQGANLEHTHLESAVLGCANLEGANLWGARLAGAELHEANLEGAQVFPDQLGEAWSLEAATLPDGTALSWDNWESEFEAWRERQEEQDSNE